MRALPIPETAGVKVLMYHWVDRHPGQKLRKWGLTPEAFEAQMSALAEGGYRVLSLDEVLQVVRGERPSSPKAVALTFDDGYLGLLDYALPILNRFGFRATFFLVSDRMGGTNTWDARHGDRPRSLMGWSEAAALAGQGMEIGSHSRTHPFLTNLSEPEMESEIRGSKETIEDRLGRPVRYFSYPHGLHDSRCRRLVAAAGYAGAFSSLDGGNGAGMDPFSLRRSEITHDDGAWSFSFKARTGFGIRSWAAATVEEMLRRLAPTSRRAVS
jgi:peptidoglycan/xylan/chitin deacetylase (PgdA/CDA1 family)